jgi:hypothetical protein
MRRIIFHYHTGEVGSSGIDYAEHPDDVSDEDLNEEAWQSAIQHAESYGKYPAYELENCTDQELDELTQSGEIDNYTESIEGWWEDYDPKRHDQLKPGGGNWAP